MRQTNTSPTEVPEGEKRKKLGEAIFKKENGREFSRRKDICVYLDVKIRFFQFQLDQKIENISTGGKYNPDLKVCFLVTNAGHKNRLQNWLDHMSQFPAFDLQKTLKMKRLGEGVFKRVTDTLCFYDWSWRRRMLPPHFKPRERDFGDAAWQA